MGSATSSQVDAGYKPRKTINICSMKNMESIDLSDPAVVYGVADIRNTVCDNDVVLFTSGECGYCSRAQSMLSDAGINFINVPANATQRHALQKLTGVGSVPNVWVKGTYVGGCNDGPEEWMGVRKLLETGKLRDMLK